MGFGVFASLLTTLIENYGWRNAYLYIGLALLVYVPIAAHVIRSRPEDIGLLPDGDAPSVSTVEASGEKAAAPVVEGWRLGKATTY